MAQQESEIASSRLAAARLRERGVRYCLAAYVDIHGVPKAKAVPIDDFERMMSGSELFTGAALEGLDQGPNDDELSVHPDLEAITQLPWQPEVAWAPGSLYYHGAPYPLCSRNVLQRQRERAAASGFVFSLGIETEIFLVRREGGRIAPANPRDTIRKAAYDVWLLLDAFPWVDEMVRYMNELGWHVNSLDHEDANSQFEFDWEYRDCLVTSDRFTLFRMMAKALADRHGIIATFMPKPYADRTGNGAHFNMSLADLRTGQNVFDDSAHPYNLSQLGHWFIGGLLAHADALCAVWAPTVNSYKRLIKGGSRTGYTWAPIFATFGRNNRTNMLRVPLMGGRVECRTADSTCNPYLASAFALAAGLEGIERQLDPGPNYEINLYELSDEEIKRHGVRRLPQTLLEAVAAFENDSLAPEVFGTQLHREYCELKYAEWWDYHSHVSDWELERYLTKF